MSSQVHPTGPDASPKRVKKKSRWAPPERTEPWPRFMTSCASPKRMVWDLVLALFLLYIGLFLPLNLAYELPAGQGWRTFDAMVDCFFWADIVVCFRTSFLREDGMECTDGWKVAKNYLYSFFIIDLMSCLPGYPMDRLLAGGESAQSAKLGKSAKAFKAVRALKLTKAIRMLKLERIMATLEENFLIKTTFLNIIKMFLITFFFAHLNACLFSYISHFDVDEMYSNSWIADAGLLNGTPQSEYITSLYWSVTTITTVGYGDITPSNDTEKIYCLFAMCIGVGFYGYIIGTVTSLVTSTSVSQRLYMKRMDAVRAYIQVRQLPRPLGIRVYQYFKYFYQEKTALDEGAIMESMSEPLRNDVRSFLMEETLDQLPFFADLDSVAISKLFSLLKPLKVQKGRYLYRSGSEGDEMFILIKGSLQEVVDKSENMSTEVFQSTSLANVDEAQIVQLRKLDPVVLVGSETTFGVSTSRAFSMRALEDSSLFMLSVNDMTQEFSKFPEILQHINKFVAQQHDIIANDKERLQRIQDYGEYIKMPSKGLGADNEPAVKRIKSMNNKFKNMTRDINPTDLLLKEESKAEGTASSQTAAGAGNGGGRSSGPSLVQPLKPQSKDLEPGGGRDYSSRIGSLERSMGSIESKVAEVKAAQQQMLTLLQQAMEQ